jgi:hypothetical protein
MVVAVVALSVAMSASAVAVPGGQSAKRTASTAAPEAYREVGSPGNPAFEAGCTNLGGQYETAAFFKDRQGMVHLKGAVTCTGTSQNAFLLPPGYRPADNKFHVELGVVRSADDGDGEIVVDGHTGVVTAPNASGSFFLDGIEFRALN